MNTPTPRPWQVDDGLVSITDQADMLKEDVGTDREWVCAGIADEEGFAEVVALAHPSNAALIVRAVNTVDTLAEAVRQLRTAMVQLGKEHHREVAFADAALAAYDGTRPTKS